MEKIFQIQAEIYGEENIRRAIADFSDIADIIYENDTLKISAENAEEIDEISHEFMNYSI